MKQFLIANGWNIALFFAYSMAEFFKGKDQSSANSYVEEFINVLKRMKK